MAKNTLKVDVNPEIIKWARETSGWTIEECSKKLKTSQEVYKEIESGKKSPSLRQLKILAQSFKRPLSVFFLPKPPVEPSIASQFRILPKSEKEISKELRLAIRKARYYQSIANELMLDLNIDQTPKIVKVTPYDSPQEVALKERKESGISILDQIRCKNAYEAFDKWRNFVESKNILVFQFKFSLKDARGFCLVDKLPYVIVVNSEDNILARIFTLFHEYAHLLLGISEIYIEELVPDTEIERWCNSFASEFLVPEEEIKKIPEFQLFLQTKELTQERMEILSGKLKISKKALITKLKTLNLLSPEEYKEKEKQLEQIKHFRTGMIITTPERRCIHEKGRKFISTILEGKEKGLLTTKELLETLSIQLGRLEKLEKLL